MYYKNYGDQEGYQDDKRRRAHPTIRPVNADSTDKRRKELLLRPTKNVQRGVQHGQTKTKAPRRSVPDSNVEERRGEEQEKRGVS